jgi:hypothetical protein
MADIYMKKLTPQELGYRKGYLHTGQYFYITKSAVGVIFEELSREILNDSRQLTFNDPLELGNVIHATYVFHNDKFCRDDGTRNEYRIYLNREIAKHDLHFEPEDIVVFIKLPNDSFELEHFKPRNRFYGVLREYILNSPLRGNHALLSNRQYVELKQQFEP